MGNETFNDKFKKLFYEYGFNLNNNSFLLAVSGGLDSMCMFDLFLKNKIKFSVCHCNYNLRGSDSKEDLKFVKEISKLNAINFYSKNMNAEKNSAIKKISLQMSARYLRYDWFDKLLKKTKIDFLCTAHHLNDNVETVIYNLSKSTGYRGIRGIKVFRDKIFRPLMNFTRDELENYAIKNNLVWRNDTSNELLKYNRNKIRLNIVPYLKEINPSLEKSINDTSNRFFEFEKFIEFSLIDIIKQCAENLNNGLKVDFLMWEKRDKSFFLLKEYLLQFGFNYDQLSNIIKSIQGIPGKHFESNTHKLILERDSLFILEKKNVEKLNINVTENGKYNFFNNKIKFEIIDDSNFYISKHSNIAHLDFGKINFPFIIRKWQDGDSFRPYGLNGRKKVSDFLIDKKVPNYIKISQGVLLHKNKIIWLIGHQIDDNYKVTDKTKKILKISII